MLAWKKIALLNSPSNFGRYPSEVVAMRIGGLTHLWSKPWLGGHCHCRVRFHPVVRHHLPRLPLLHRSLGSSAMSDACFLSLQTLILHFHLLSPPSAGLPVQCRPVRASEETGMPRQPRTIRTNTGWAPIRGAQYPALSPPWVGPQPVARHLPRVPALISWCVCTPGKGNAHVPSIPWPSQTAPTKPSSLFSFQPIMTTDKKSSKRIEGENVIT